MVPLGTGKTASSFLRDPLGLGWAQGMFGHDFDFNLADFSTYITREATVRYGVPGSNQVQEEVNEGLAIDDDAPPATSLAGSVNTFGYSVEDDGEFTVGSAPNVEGFISEDDSVNASVDVSGSPKLNNIRLELTK